MFFQLLFFVNIHQPSVGVPDIGIYVQECQNIKRIPLHSHKETKS